MFLGGILLTIPSAYTYVQIKQEIKNILENNKTIVINDGRNRPPTPEDTPMPVYIVQDTNTSMYLYCEPESIRPVIIKIVHYLTNYLKEKSSFDIMVETLYKDIFSLRKE